MDSPLGTPQFVVTFHPSLVSAIQERVLQRMFHDALYPRLMFRSEAEREEWAANLGTTMSFTRSGLIRVTTRPVKAGQDPTPKSWSTEQWDVTAEKWGDSVDTHMPTSNVSIASTYLRNIHNLGLHAGQSLNRVTRDKLFNAYTSGNTVLRISQVAGTSVPVVSLCGFTRKIRNGRPEIVSPTNPLAITIVSGGVATAFNVVGFTSDFANDEIHSGVLTLSGAGHSGLFARDIVLAGNRAKVVRSGGSLSIDGISSADTLSMADLRLAIAQLRVDNAPVHEDSTFHCHLDPQSELEVFGDQEFQRLNQSLPDYVHYREFALASFGQTTFYRNTENPLVATVDQDPDFGFTFSSETRNTTPAGAQGIEIHRAIITARGAMEEKYIDESKYISDAGVTGKIGEFSVVNNGMQVVLDGIRLIMRAPLDRFQELTSATWSMSGGWGIPTDSVSVTSTQDYKRAVVIEHG